MTDAKMNFLKASIIRPPEENSWTFPRFKLWFGKVGVCNIKATINSCWARNGGASDNEPERPFSN